MASSPLASHLLAHRDALLRYLRARGAADDAEDLLQELWMKLQAAPPTGVEDALPYLYRMAHNLMIDRARGAVRRRRRESDYGADEDRDEMPSAEQALVARDQLHRVERLLGALGARTDYIFRRHRVELVPQRVIADELHLSLSAVEKHLQKAYRALASHRNEQGDDLEGTGDGRR